MILERRHAISGAFVFLLLGIFAVFSMLLIVLGAQAYRVTVEQTAEHAKERIAYAYVRNAVRADDAAGTLTAGEVDGIPALMFTEELDGERYVKTIYCYDGELRELFASEEYAFSPEEGERVCEAQSLAFETLGQLLRVTITDADGGTQTVDIARRCAE